MATEKGKGKGPKTPRSKRRFLIPKDYVVVRDKVTGRYEAVPASEAKSGSMHRLATQRLGSSIEETTLVLEFEGERRPWYQKLPEDKEDVQKLRAALDLIDAKLDGWGATDGQKSRVKKILSDNGWKLRRHRPKK